MLLFFGLLAIALAIMGAAILLSKTIFTVRVSQGYLVPKEFMPKTQKPALEQVDFNDKTRPSRRARDITPT